MIRAAKQISFTVIFTIILVLTIALCISGTVISQAKNEQRAVTKYYRAMEQEYVQTVREFLNERGYRNSGVTMTETVDADGSRSYTVTIHHQKINNLSAGDKAELLSACETLVFLDESSSVSHKFLEEDL